MITVTGPIGDPFNRLAGAKHRVTDPSDPLHCSADTSAYWSRANVSEACPGVLTPLTWALWSQTSDHAEFGMFGDLGITPRRFRAPTSLDDQSMAIFHGRLYMNFDVMRRSMDRFGTAGADYEQHHFGTARALPAVARPWPRYPAMALRIPWTLLTIGARVRRELAQREAGWSRAVDRMLAADLDQARFELQQGFAAFDISMRTQTLATAIATTVLGVLASKLAAIDPELARPATSGAGGTREVAMLDMLWQVARGEVTMARFLGHYGYCTPRDGELSSRPWRADTAPLLPALGLFTQGDPQRGPAASARASDDTRAEARARLLQKVSGNTRRTLRWLMSFSDHMTRVREDGKAAYLLAIDHARAAADRIGSLMADQGVLAAPADIVFLLPEEIGRLPFAEVRDLVAARRHRRDLLSAMAVPDNAAGCPVATPIDLVAVKPNSINGQGVSPGIAVGNARVMRDAGDLARFAPGDILVAASTDPSWAPLMTVAGGIVTDQGGFLSHGAVVARELGTPAVVGTRQATTLIADGALIIIDGKAGTVRPATVADAELHRMAGKAMAGKTGDQSKPAGQPCPAPAAPDGPDSAARILPFTHMLGSGEFGGKAASLASATGAGLTVPPGWALNPAAVRQILAGDAALREQTTAMLGELGGLVAVRSSAMGEDGDAASFAGQHETVLGVCDNEALIAAIARVYGSGQRSRDYGASLGIKPGEVAIVIQRQLRPDCAGVLFSHDPVTGQARRLVEAVWGLGEALVSGATIPARWTFLPEVTTLEYTAGQQDFRLDVDDHGGLVRTALEVEAASAQCLPAAHLNDLDRLAEACAKLMGCPQDIEWAIAGGQLYLLQSRPITTLAPRAHPAAS